MQKFKRYSVFHPDYTDYLKSFVKKDKALYKTFKGRTVVVEGIDTNYLLEKNLITETDLYFGEVYLLIDVNTLIAAKEIDPVKKLLDALYPEEIKNVSLIYIDYYLRGETSEAKKSLQRLIAVYDYDSNYREYEYDVEYDIEYFNCLAAYYHLFDDISNISEYYLSKKYYSSTNTLLKTAYLLFETDDVKRSETFLERATIKAVNTTDYLSCAKAWKRLFNNDIKSLDCVSMGTKNAANFFDWLYCSIEWKAMFNNDKYSLESFRKAEKVACCTFDWTMCAETWQKHHNNKEKALDRLNKAIMIYDNDKYGKYGKYDKYNICVQEAFISYNNAELTNICLNHIERITDFDFFYTTSKEKGKGFELLTTLVKALGNGHFDKKIIENLLLKAECFVNDKSKWIVLAYKWKRIAGNNEMSLRCLQKAVNIDDFDLLTDCVKCYVLLFDDIVEAERCMARAMILVKSSYDFIRCAYAWKSYLNNIEEYKKCLNKAFALACEPYDYIELTHLLKYFCEDYEQTAKSIRHFENLCDNSHDWFIAAELWANVLNNMEESDRCLQIYLSSDIKSREDYFVAQCFLNIGNTHKCLEFLQKATDVGKGYSVMLECALMWKYLGNHNKAEDCLNSALTYVKFYDERIECARICLMVFEDVDKAKNCLKQALDTAENIEQRFDATILWLKLFNDKKNYRFYMSQTIAMIDKYKDLIRCSFKIHTNFNDTFAIRQMLTKATDIAKGFDSLHECSVLWWMFLSDKEKSKECIDKARKLAAKKSLCYIDCAEIYKLCLEDEAAAKQCINKAIAFSKSMYDMIRCADVEYSILNSHDNIMVFVKKFIETSGDSLACSKFATTLSKGEKDASACMHEALINIKTPKEYLSNAVILKVIFHDDYNAKELLKSALNKIDDVPNLLSCAYLFKHYFNDNELATECAYKAYSLSQSFQELMLCSKTWYLNANNQVEMERALAQAAIMANTFREYVILVKAFALDASLESKAISYMNSAVQKVSTPDEHWQCILIWDYVFKDKEQIDNCINLRQSF